MQRYNTIMKGFKKTIAKLESLCVACDTEVAENDKKTAALAARSIRLKNEAAAANEASRKLRNLIGA